MGLTGTFEGYVPMATDLYLRGKSLVGFSKYSNYDYPVFDSGQLTLNAWNNAMQASVNLTGFSHVNFEIYKTSTSSGRWITLQVSGDPTRWAKADLDSTVNVTQVISINLGVLAINGAFAFEFAGWRGAVYRIWLS